MISSTVSSLRADLPALVTICSALLAARLRLTSVAMRALTNASCVVIKGVAALGSLIIRSAAKLQPSSASRSDHQFLRTNVARSAGVVLVRLAVPCK